MIKASLLNFPCKLTKRLDNRNQFLSIVLCIYVPFLQYHQNFLIFLRDWYILNVPSNLPKNNVMNWIVLRSDVIVSVCIFASMEHKKKKEKFKTWYSRYIFMTWTCVPSLQIMVYMCCAILFYSWEEVRRRNLDSR